MLFDPEALCLTSPAMQKTPIARGHNLIGSTQVHGYHTDRGGKQRAKEQYNFWIVLFIWRSHNHSINKY